MNKFIPILIVAVLAVACMGTEEDMRAEWAEEEKTQFLEHVNVLDAEIEKESSITQTFDGLKCLHLQLLSDSVPHFSHVSFVLEEEKKQLSDPDLPIELRAYYNDLQSYGSAIPLPEQRVVSPEEQSELCEALFGESDINKLFYEGQLMDPELLTERAAVSATNIYIENGSANLALNKNAVLFKYDEILEAIDHSYDEFLDEFGKDVVEDGRLLFKRVLSGKWESGDESAYRDEVMHISAESVHKIARIQYVVLTKTVLERGPAMMGKDSFETGYLAEKFVVYDLHKQETIASFFIFVENSDQLSYREGSVSFGGRLKYPGEKDLRERMDKKLKNKLWTALIEELE